ncbi:MAG: hypothetical protein KDA64_02095 [Rhodospirillaceae bacterium]|nr:hypothetical protein [Rhodospirillaceae bacterium]
MDEILRWGPDIRSGRNQPETYWKTDRARFLDSPQVQAIVRDAVRGRSASAFWQTQSQEFQGQAPKQVIDLLIAELQTDRGVQIETLLATLAATAGFACQMAVREMHGLPEAPVQRSLLVEVGTKDGGTFYFGDALTAYILRPPQQGLSILTFVASALLKLGEPVFDIKPIFERTAQQVGSPTYGRPTVAAAHLPLNHPIDLLWKYWHVVRATLVLNNLKPTVWPLALARCIHVLMVEHTRLLTPGIAGRLAMETAISMSHIAPSKIPHAWFFEGPRIEGSPASDLRSAEYLYIPESQLY